MNVGVIGLGYWGPNIVRNFLSHEEVDRVVCCDKDAKQLQKIKKNFHSVETTSNADDIFNDPKIDAVAIVTSVFTHYDLAKKALQKDKHIFVEKPFTATVAQAEELISLAEKKKKVAMVDHTFLYTPAIKKIKELMKKGDIGDIFYFDSVRVNLGLFQSDVNVIWDLAPHDFSMMQYLLDKKPLTLKAMGADHTGSGLEDTAYVHIDFGNNLIAHFHLNWLSPVKIRKVLIGGTKKMVVFDDMENSEKVKLYDKGINVKSKEDEYQKLVKYLLGDSYSPMLDNKEAFREVIGDFISAVKKGTKPISSCYEGLKVVKLLEATQQSIKSNGKLIHL